MYRKPRLAGIVIILIILSCQITAMAGEMHLTSDRMEYDPEKGIIYAEGNVVLTRAGMTITSEKGEGSVDGTKALFWDSVKGEGIWSEEEVNFSCEMAEARFSPDSFYALKGKVNGIFGQRAIIAESLEMTDDTFNAVSVDKFKDLSSRIEMSGNSISGTLKDKEVVESIAEGNVKIILEDDKGNKTFVFGKKAVYSQKRGSVVVTGNARALQGERSIKAQSLVLFPETNRIEAVGKSTLVITPEKRKGN